MVKQELIPIARYREYDANGNPVSISEMDEDEIRNYLCPLAYGKLEKCLSCKGREKCTAGRRVMEIRGAMQNSDDEETKNQKRKGIGFRRVQEARMLCEMILSEEDPVKSLMDYSDINYKAAAQRLRVWSRKYADIFESHGVTDKMLRDSYWKKMKQVKDSEADEPEDEPEVLDDNAPVSDEISVEDLLNEVGEIAEESEGSVENSPEDSAEEMPPEESPERNQDWRSIDEVFEKLRHEEDECRRIIREKEERLAWLEEQMDALIKVRVLLDRNTETAKSLITA